MDRVEAGKTLYGVLCFLAGGQVDYSRVPAIVSVKGIDLDAGLQAVCWLVELPFQAIHTHDGLPVWLGARPTREEMAQVLRQLLGRPAKAPAKQTRHDNAIPTSSMMRVLGEALLPDEELVAALEGIRGQCIALTPTRVILLKVGLSSGALLGRKWKSFLLREITAFENSCGFTQGRVQISVAGTVEQSHGITVPGDRRQQAWSAFQAENVCEYGAAQRPAFLRFTQLLQTRLNELAGSTDISPPSQEVASQLRTLAALRDDGIITDTEFEAKKRELLARI